MSDQPTLPEIEDVIAQIASEILGSGHVRHDDNLLELGVDSLGGTTIVVELQQRLGVDIPLAALFDNPVVVNFSQVILDIMKEQAKQQPS